MTIATQATGNLFDLIATLDNSAKIPALRAITHSAMAKAIGAVRQHLRNEQRTQVLADGRELALSRNEEIHNTIDQRNDYDENTRSVAEVANAMGFPAHITPMEQAHVFHSVYDWAHDELMTLVTSKWDAPLSLDGMLDFMTTKAQPLDKILIKALAEASGCEEDVIVRLHELQELEDRAKLIAMLPEIKAIFNGFAHNQSEADGFGQLPIVAQHAFGIKVFESLTKENNKILTRVMKTRRMTDLASIPLVKAGAADLKEWVEAFETENAQTIRDAIDNGLNIRSVEEAARV